MRGLRGHVERHIERTGALHVTSLVPLFEAKKSG
jgi:hypothetical protein